MAAPAWLAALEPRAPDAGVHDLMHLRQLHRMRAAAEEQDG